MSTIQENLRSLIGEDVTVWGPYMCADGRQRIDIKPVSASRSTTHQFAKNRFRVETWPEANLRRDG